MQIKLQNQYYPINSITLLWKIYVLLLKANHFGNAHVVLTAKASLQAEPQAHSTTCRGCHLTSFWSSFLAQTRRLGPFGTNMSSNASPVFSYRTAQKMLNFQTIIKTNALILKMLIEHALEPQEYRPDQFKRYLLFCYFVIIGFHLKSYNQSRKLAQTEIFTML